MIADELDCVIAGFETMLKRRNLSFSARKSLVRYALPAAFRKVRAASVETKATARPLRLGKKGEGMKMPTVKVHQLAEVIAKKLFSIETCPPDEQRRMVRRAAKAAVEWYESRCCNRCSYWIEDENSPPWTRRCERLSWKESLWTGPDFGCKHFKDGEK